MMTGPLFAMLLFTIPVWCTRTLLEDPADENAAEAEEEVKSSEVEGNAAQILKSSSLKTLKTVLAEEKARKTARELNAVETLKTVVQEARAKKAEEELNKKIQENPNDGLAIQAMKAHFAAKTAKPILRHHLVPEESPATKAMKHYLEKHGVKDALEKLVQSQDDDDDNDLLIEDLENELDSTESQADSQGGLAISSGPVLQPDLSRQTEPAKVHQDLLSQEATEDEEELKATAPAGNPHKLLLDSEPHPIEDTLNKPVLSEDTSDQQKPLLMNNGDRDRQTAEAKPHHKLLSQDGPVEESKETAPAKPHKMLLDSEKHPIEDTLNKPVLPEDKSDQQAPLLNNGDKDKAAKSSAYQPWRRAGILAFALSTALFLS